jgi:phosphoenolpyruvate synthase/pyruvate phosphate dikinase
MKNDNWELYIARPFTLFGASLWYAWYSSELYKKIIGANTKNCLMIEYPRGVVRYYRLKDEQKKLFSAFDNFALKQGKKLETLLKQGVLLNKKVVKLLQKNSFKNIPEAIDFLIELSLLCTVLPFRSGDVVFKKGQNKKLIGLINKLRSVSNYEKVINKIIIPLAFKQIKKFGLKKESEINNFSLKEILESRINFSKRSLDKKDKYFVYQVIQDKEKITWIKNPEKFIRNIEKRNVKEKINNFKEKENLFIKGTSAQRGLIKGRVRLVLDNNIKKVIFNNNDILVSISTSPELMPLIKKCGAIITDEGGLTCHAAIVSRELKKPCIIGTKIATSILRDGDMVEVDANKGIVKRLKK